MIRLGFFYNLGLSNMEFLLVFTHGMMKFSDNFNFFVAQKYQEMFVFMSKSWLFDRILLI